MGEGVGDMNVPETITPWLVLISTFIATLAAVGAALLWLRRKAAEVFTAAVTEAAGPITREVASIAETARETLTLAKNTATALAVQTGHVSEQLAARNVVADDRFTALERRMANFEIRQSRDTQTIVEAVQQSTPPAGNGGT